MYAEQNHDHHPGKSEVAFQRRATAAKNPVQSGTDQERESNQPKRRAEQSEGFNSQIFHVSERESILPRMRHQNITDVRACRERVSHREDAHCSGKTQETNDQQHKRCGFPSLPLRTWARRFSFSLHPAACEQGQSRQHRQRIIFLTRGKAEKQHDHAGPHPKEQICSNTRIQTFTPFAHPPWNFLQRRE